MRTVLQMLRADMICGSIPEKYWNIVLEYGVISTAVESTTADRIDVYRPRTV
jgi:hypothetical protein